MTQAAPVAVGQPFTAKASFKAPLIAISTIATGLILRILPLLLRPELPLQTCDGRAYWDIGVSLAGGRGFFITNAQLFVPCEGRVGVGPSHHFAPALPIIEASFVRLFGPTALALVVPLVLLTVAAAVVAWWTTRDLFGNDAGLLVAAAVSLEWTGVFFGTWLGYSENLVLIAITLTLWAILRGLRDDRFMVLAGAFAGVGYLSKASIGWFFLVAGVGGLVYRVIFRGWRVLRNRWYWAAVAVFAVPVVLWSYRNISLFWDGTLAGLADAWQTSALHSQILADAFHQPVLLLIGMLGKLPIVAGLLFLPFVPLAGAFGPALRHWRDEDSFGLWLAAGLILVLGVFFAAAFWVNDQTSLLWADPVRYVSPAQVPLLWLVVKHGSPSRLAWSASFLILAATCVLMPLALVPGQLLGP